MNAVIGNQFVLLIDTDELYCETQSSISFASTEISVRSDDSGDWEEFLEGGRKSGVISFSGLLINGGVNSAFDLIQNKLGKIYTFAWGGIKAGQGLIKGKMYLRSLTIDSVQNEAVTFSGEAIISGKPEFVTVTQDIGLIDEDSIFITDEDDMIILID